MDIILTLIAAVVVAFTSMQFLTVRMQKRRVVELMDEIHGLRTQVDALVSGTKGVVGRVRGIEQRLRRHGERQDELQRQGPEEVALRQSVELVRRGATVQELMDTCELSRGEAELLIRFYGEDSSESRQ